MERLHVSVSRRSLFPLLMALFGALLCIGMVQRFRDPLYDMTLEYWLYLAAGCFMVLVGLVGMRFFPWMCIIPAVCYVYGGVIEGWSDLQASGSSGLLTQIPFYQILMLVPLILLLMIRWKPWCIWMLKGLEIIAILIPFAMAWLQLQDALLELKMEGYLTDAVKQTRWMHFLMNEAVFYAGMICMTLSLRYLPPQEPVEDTEADKDAEIESKAFAPEVIPDAEPLEEAPIPHPMPEEPFPQQQPAPEFYGQPEPQATAAPEIAPIPPMQHRGGAYPYNRPIHLPSESHSEEDSQDNSEA